MHWAGLTHGCSTCQLPRTGFQIFRSQQAKPGSPVGVSPWRKTGAEYLVACLRDNYTNMGFWKQSPGRLNRFCCLTSSLSPNFVQIILITRFVFMVVHNIIQKSVWPGRLQFRLPSTSQWLYNVQPWFNTTHRLNSKLSRNKSTKWCSIRLQHQQWSLR